MGERYDREVVDQILLLRQSGMTIQAIADRLGTSRSTTHRWIQRAGGDCAETPAIAAPQAKPKPDRDEVEHQRLKDENHRLRTMIRTGHRDEALHRYIREEAFGLAQTDTTPPQWMLDTERRPGCAGTPTLLLSDWHWGETVNPRQMWGKNEYNMAIAADRARLVVERTIRLLRDDIVSDGWPGMVVPLGGDMISGSIHPELVASDEVPPAAQCADLAKYLIATLEALADEYGRLYVPCVTGNHGRATFKPQAKDRVQTSYDWLAYMFVERHFASDPRVTVHVSDETDVLYRLHNTRYLLTHGDSMGVRGGDGIIGALGPIKRGVHKMRSANAALGREFDVAIMGHWHQLIHLEDTIVNGSLKGYCEYARASRFSFEPARQALWITHPVHGITIRTAVLAQDVNAAGDGSETESVI